MAFKVNYNQQRAERDRAKAAKKEAKLREQEELTARRKDGLDTQGDQVGGDQVGGDQATGGEPAQAGEAAEKSDGAA
jgi:hypothetical protein